MNILWALLGAWCVMKFVDFVWCVVEVLWEMRKEDP